MNQRWCFHNRRFTEAQVARFLKEIGASQKRRYIEALLHRNAATQNLALSIWATHPRDLTVAPNRGESARLVGHGHGVGDFGGDHAVGGGTVARDRRFADEQ